MMATANINSTPTAQLFTKKSSGSPGANDFLFVDTTGFLFVDAVAFAFTS